MNIKAMGEQIILDVSAKKAGNEEVSEGGVFLGVSTNGEVPLHGVVIAVGDDVDTDIIALGDVCLIPNGTIKNVPDPRVITGEIRQDDAERETWIHTHYKNIAVKYVDIIKK